MAQWVRLCGVDEVPAEGKLQAMDLGGREVCVGQVNGTLCVVDNVCPHRQAPLAEGWIEDGKLVCPWHSWEFDMATGQCVYPEGEQVQAFAVRVEQGDVLVDVTAGDA